MNNGNHNATGKPSVVNYRKLRARKAYLGLTNADLAEKAGVCERTVSLFLNGDDTVRPETQDAIALALGFRRTIDFEPLQTDRDFADAVSG